MFSSIFTPPSGPRRQCYHHTHVPAPTPADGTQPSAKIPTGEFLSRFDDFFGCAHPPVTHLPTHTARVSPEQRESVGSESVPPPYEQQADPPPAPAYGTKEEPVTLSKYLFKYGFFFPLFWVVGVVIIFMGIQPAPNAEEGKDLAQQQEELAIMRRAEIRWSIHCAIALTCLGLIIGLIVCLAKMGVFKR